MTANWPTEPPEPTDLHQTKVTDELPVRNCVYCDDAIHSGEGYMRHAATCARVDDVLEIRYPNELFGLIIPEQSGRVWIGKTCGFACHNVAIQGTMLPLGRVQTFNMDAPSADLAGKFDGFDEPERAREVYLEGLRASTDHQYGGIDLGRKLVKETLAGVYLDDEAEQERLYKSRSDRITAVWDQIDERLPFEYERVAAPVGRPVTQEGLRWVNVTGSTANRLAKPAWVSALVEREEPVAMYYPNSD